MRFELVKIEVTGPFLTFFNLIKSKSWDGLSMGLLRYEISDRLQQVDSMKDAF